MTENKSKITDNIKISENQEDKDSNAVYDIRISKQDLDLIFKFLLKMEIRGYEVPEINKIFIALDPRNYKKVDPIV